MTNFAIHNGSAVVNVIVANSKEVAEQVTGLQAVETTGEPWIGWELVDGEWVDPTSSGELIQTIEDEDPKAETPE
jgi:hypothetical protein